MLNLAGSEKLAKLYPNAVHQLVLGMNLDANEVLISKTALQLALAEARTDMEIMQQRRKSNKGISISKIAGILAFRLSRFAPVQLIGNAAEDDRALRLNQLAALALVLKEVMHLDIAQIQSKHITMELQYTLVRRHTNQETLGLVFDLIKSSVK